MITTPIQIRFSDCDMGGHVHNVVYLNYFEIARIGFFISALSKEWNWKKNGIIVKKNTIEYHIPTVIEDEIKVGVACNHIGNKSFTLTYEVKDSKNNLKASGESLIVCYDYTKQKTASLTSEMEQLLKAHFTG